MHCLGNRSGFHIFIRMKQKPGMLERQQNFTRILSLYLALIYPHTWKVQLLHSATRKIGFLSGEALICLTLVSVCTLQLVCKSDLEWQASGILPSHFQSRPAMLSNTHIIRKQTKNYKEGQNCVTIYRAWWICSILINHKICAIHLLAI